jgi:amidase
VTTTSILDKDEIGAFCRFNHVEAQGARSGPLAGLTFAAKDIYDIAGAKTSFGNPDWLRTHEPPRVTAPAVQMLLDAGARLAGKTHTEEMAWSLTGENAHYGTPINVAAPGRIPGGSSSGSAAAVAAGLVDFSLGSDTGGSVRLPASYCGILGMRPTHGRISLEGVCPLAPSFDTCGWFARDAQVFERVGRVLLRDSAPPRKPGRLLAARDAFAFADDAARPVLEQALARVAALLGSPEEITVGDEPLEQWTDCFRFPQGGEAWAAHRDWITRVKPAFGPAIKGRFEWAATVKAADVERAWTRCSKATPCSRCPARQASRCRGARRRRWWMGCAPARCRCCASPASPACRRYRSPSRLSRAAPSACLLSRPEITTRCY